MKTIRIIIGLTLLLLFNAVLWGNPEIAKIIFDQGMELYMKRDFKGAAQYFGQVVDMQPHHYHARYYYAVSLSARGNTRKALEQVEFLKQVFPYERAYVDLEQSILSQMAPPISVATKQAAQPTERRTKATKSVVLSNESIIEHEDSYAIDYEEKSTPRPARPVVKAKQMSPAIEEIRNLIDERRFSEAELLATNILKKEPKNHEVYAALGYSEFTKQNHEKAVEHFKQSIELGSKEFDNHFLLGSSYLSLNKPKEAASSFEAALKIDANDVFTKQFLADIYLKEGKYSAAEKYFEEILKNDSEILDAQVGLAEIKFEQGLIDDAVTGANQVLSKNKNNSRAHFLKARALLENKLYSEAIEESELAYSLDNSRTDYLVFKSLVRIKNFQIQEALDELEKIIDEDPFNIHALITMAEALITMGSVTQGKQMLQAAEGHERLPKTSLLLALAELDGKNYTRAEKYFNDYCRRSNNSPHSLYEYAKFTELVKEPKEIVAAYEKVVKAYPKTPYGTDAKAAIERVKSNSQSSSSPKRKVIPD
jgi:tetratricopeptide (TPR) repeat protein